MNQLMNNENLTLSSFTFWKKVNELRNDDGQNNVEYGKFLVRVIDECDDTGVPKTFRHPQNKKEMQYFDLNQDQMLLIGMRESKSVRKKMLIWVKSLTTNQFQLPQTYAQALQVCADQAFQLEAQAPKIAFVDKYVHADSGNKTFRQVCKLLNVKENVFRPFLVEEKIMYRLNGEWAAHANHITSGRFATKTGVSDNDHAFNTAYFTPKGVEWVAAQFAKFNLNQEK